MVPIYPLASQLVPDVLRIRRSQLVEVDRLGLQVDLVIYQSDSGDPQLAVFKYTLIHHTVPAIWHEVNLLIRLPKHPNIVILDHVVIDSVDDEDRLISLTTPFVPEGNLEDSPGRLFRLKHLKQLTEVVDLLNLELGVTHGDILPRNLLIDPTTDDLKIFDYNWGYRIGWDGDPQNSDIFGHNPDRNDVKYVIFTFYELITRGMHFRLENNPEDLKTTMVTDVDPWEKHPDVRLDADVADYRRFLEAWVESRREIDAKMASWTQARSPLDWPCLPEFPLVHVDWISIPLRLSRGLR